MPASVAALHACLEELASAIEAQKKVLADLEHTRIAIRRQLNGLCDPITRLPLEISSEIFIQCLNSTSLSPPNPSVAPLLLLNISNSWTNIALSTTALWADLALDISSTRFRATEQCTEFFSRWLCRARARPLALSLHGFASPEIAITVAGHALQMRELLLVVPRRAQLE
ncbi:hypothetical protein FB451DRAFT_1568245 [Mycena latifolia]|nr:hypothetical protein FB451DRAFT_1568245 [Mycena latifolia]